MATALEAKQILDKMLHAESFEDYRQHRNIAKGTVEETTTSLIFHRVRRDARERTLKRMGRVR
jgi:hypothetical protein